jgi:hypothetical protein
MLAVTISACATSIRQRVTEPQPSVDAGAVAKRHWPWAAVVLAGIADVATTAVGLSIGLTEGNPFVAPLIHEWGLAALVVLKAAVVVGLFCLVRGLPRPASNVAGQLISLVWTFAVGFNVAGIMMAGGLA